MNLSAKKERYNEEKRSKGGCKKSWGKEAPQGRKIKHKPCPAKYHNWLTPFCWKDIIIVAKQVGWQMSASEIANGLKRRNPDTFGKINRNTIEGWIDRSGAKPKWKESVLCRVDDGNNPGHDKGGQQGLLVSTVLQFLSSV